MLSRRAVRIKVMQVLYALNSTHSEPTASQGVKMYRDMVDRSYQLYLFNLLLLLRVAEYARQDEARRKSKLRPSDEDRNFRAILADNASVQSLAKNHQLGKYFNRYQFARYVDVDLVRQLYSDFSQEEAYDVFLRKGKTEVEPVKEVLLELYRFLLNHEHFVSMIEDAFPLWMDDRSLIVGAMKKTLKGLPAEENFTDGYRPSYETVTEFGESLLSKTLDTDAELLALIEPVLKNWDADRVAIIDMILIKMALSEFITFPTIPTKVTLNEYLDISKAYSTDKSKEFVNGILDRLMRKLKEEGLIQKEGRGLED
jgi:transcription antitermination protein NusB